MLKPPELQTEAGRVVWEVLTAAVVGDVEAMRRLLAEDPKRSREGYFYTPPIHFAVREGHVEIVKMLLDAGADAEWNAYYGGSLIDMSKERGHEEVANLLIRTRDQRGRTAPSPSLEDHPIHTAAQANDVRRVCELLDSDPSLLNRGDRAGGTPLHRAVAASARAVVKFLLDRGADIHAIHGTGAGSPGGFSPHDVQAIDIAIWGGFGPRRRPTLWRMAVRWLQYWLCYPFKKRCRQPCDVETARLLLSRGANYDLTIAAALGDLLRIKAILDQDPAKIREVRPNGKRPLSTAVQCGHEDIARYLLGRGADPTWPELSADKGSSLHEAARVGNKALAQLLLAHGADPNAHVDSSGNAVYAAKTPEIRALLEAHGGSLDPYDLVWKGEDDEVIRRVTKDPGSADLGCGGVFTAVVTLGKRDLLKRLLDAGIRVPRVVTGCQSYLLEQPDMLRALLGSGMHPDTCNWQKQTMLHMLCSHDPDGRQRDHNILCAGMLLDAGANISAQDEDYSSTPLGWAARNDNLAMAEFLLSRGAPTNLPDDKPWATPLAWATRRGHTRIADVLRKAGATS
jgi:ankyrin repeat protein